MQARMQGAPLAGRFAQQKLARCLAGSLPTGGVSSALLRISRRSVLSHSSANGNGVSHSGAPSPAETARTITSMVSEGVLSTLCASSGVPMGTPVSFSLDKEGGAWVHLSPSGPEMACLKASPKASLTVQPTSYPARSVACVTLSGEVDVSGEAPYQIKLNKAYYFGGLDASASMVEVSPEEFEAAQPDVLRDSATELVGLWNEERAEDLYRIVSHQMDVPLTDMAYAEMVWVDRLGMYVRVEVDGREPDVVRVPFYRPVLDERDARSVITMAAQIAWEAERAYTPMPVPAADAVVNN